MSSHIRFLLFSFFLLFPLTDRSEAFPSEIKTNLTLVVFDDVHCAFDELTSLPGETGTIDDKPDRNGGGISLVSSGDLILQEGRYSD